MTVHSTRNILATLFLTLISLTTKAQLFETRTGVDTISLQQRISLHTNAIDWTLGIPNVGGEFDVIGTNWGRHAIGIDLRGRFATNHTFKPNFVYNVTGARIYYRNYYRLRAISGSVEKSKGILNRLFSCRRQNIKHKKRTYYRGLYLDFSDFSLKLGGEGKQGTALTFGVTYGWLTPLITFRNGHTLDFDLGFSAGACMANVTRFTRDRDDNCYRKTSEVENKIMPALTEVKVGFVYRFNNYPITKRYRWRYDVDMNYRERMDNLRDSLAEVQRQKNFSDSVRTRFTKDYNTIYDSIAKVNSELRAKKQAADKIAAAKKAHKEKVKAEEAKKQAKLYAKKEEKAETTDKKKTRNNNSKTTPQIAGEKTEKGKAIDAEANMSEKKEKRKEAQE